MPARKSTRRGTTAAPLKNYLSEASLSNIMEAIRRTLAEGGARRVAFDHGITQRVRAIIFTLPIGEQLATFRLPARQESVGPLLKESYRTAGRSCPTGEAFAEQVERVAWANIRDWLAGQVALIRTQMVKSEEVFFPYLLVEGYEQPTTAFEVFEQHRALPMPEQHGLVSIVEDRI